MSLLALGLNHHTAPVSIRERVAIGENRLTEALNGLKGVSTVNEATIVSTCNRTEIYCGIQGADSTPVSQWLHRYLHLDPSQFTHHLFEHTDRQVVHHLMRVCSGLDSMVLGEPQILGQIKQAYREATEQGAVGAELSPLFESAFSVAKQVRTDTAIGSSPVSVAFAAVALAKQIFDDFNKQNALLIGAGDTISLTAKHLMGNNIGGVAIANRTVSRAQALAKEVNGSALGLSELNGALSEADIIISSTGSPLPILGKGALENAMKARRFRPMLIVDIAVPRDIEPQVGEIDGLFLYTVDDLQSVIDEGMQTRREAADQAENIVENEVDAFMRRVRALGATRSIRDYRQSCTDISEQLLLKSRKQLASGQDPEKVLQQLSHALTNKLMNAPTQRMREAAEDGDLELLKAARTLFDLDKPEK